MLARACLRTAGRGRWRLHIRSDSGVSVPLTMAHATSRHGGVRLIHVGPTVREVIPFTGSSFAAGRFGLWVTSRRVPTWKVLQRAGILLAQALIIVPVACVAATHLCCDTVRQRHRNDRPYWRSEFLIRNAFLPLSLLANIQWFKELMLDLHIGKHIADIMTALLDGTLKFRSRDTLNRMLLLSNMLSQLEPHQADLFNQWVPSLLLIAQRTEEHSAMSLCASTFLKLLGNAEVLGHMEHENKQTQQNVMKGAFGASLLLAQGQDVFFNFDAAAFLHAIAATGKFHDVVLVPEFIQSVKLLFTSNDDSTATMTAKAVYLLTESELIRTALIDHRLHLLLLTMVSHGTSDVMKGWTVGALYRLMDDPQCVASVVYSHGVSKLCDCLGSVHDHDTRKAIVESLEKIAESNDGKYARMVSWKVKKREEKLGNLDEGTKNRINGLVLEEHAQG